MKVLNNYDGSSINIEKIDQSSNRAYLKLKDENGKACHYYNFIVENDADIDGTVYILNNNKSIYYSKNSFTPFVYENEKWKKLTKDKYEVTESFIRFIISPKSKIELSLAPRYTEVDLIDYCTSNGLKYKNETLLKVELGNPNKPTIFIVGRQHPGETLSSFFIEGIINAILTKKELQENFHFLIYPIVNKKGVKHGNHRYVDGIDFNRSWNNNNPPEEITYLKKELHSVEVLNCFIDVHNDELTPNDYIRMNNPTQDKIADIQVLEVMSSFRRFVRALIKQRRIINLKQNTAREYVQSRYTCNSLLVELSMNDEVDSLYKKGENFIKSICNM